MRRLALATLAFPLIVASAPSLGSPLPFEESEYLPPEATTTYVERSLNDQAPLTIEHPRVPRSRVGRRSGGRGAIAGFCRDAGTVVRRDALGQPVLRQREVCDNVAPRTLHPGEVEPRPVWPARRIMRERVVRAKG